MTAGAVRYKIKSPKNAQVFMWCVAKHFCQYVLDRIGRNIQRRQPDQQKTTHLIMGKKSATKAEKEKKERPKRDALPSTLVEHLKRQAGAARLSGDARRLLMDIIKAALTECSTEATLHAIGNKRCTITRRAFKNGFQTVTGKTLC